MNDSTLLTIKEFSKFTNVAQSKLRYYDNIGLLPPAVRGKNSYRYYAPFQIFKLNYINVLSDLGVPLTKIKEMNETRTPESVIKLLGRQERMLGQRLCEIQKAYSLIHMYRQNIQSGLAADDGLIKIVEYDELHYVLGKPNEYGENESFYDAFIRYCQSADRERINTRYPIAGYHENFGSFLSRRSKPDRFVSFDPLGRERRQAGKYLIAYKRGYYGDFGDMPERLAAYIEEQGLVCTGPVYILWVLDEITIIDPEQFMMRVSIRVKEEKKKRKQKQL